MQKLRHLIYAMSGAVFFILFSEIKLYQLLLLGAVGICTGIVISLSGDKYKYDNLWIKLIGTTSSLYILFRCVRRFYSKCSTAAIVKRVMLKLSADINIVLPVLLIILAVAALPAVYRIMTALLRYIVNAIPVVNKKNLLNATICPFKVFLRSAMIAAGNIFIAVVLGLLLLYGAYSLPVDNIEKNVQASAVYIQDEGTYPKLYKWCTSQLDNFTDSIMLDEAAYDNGSDTINKVIMAYRGGIDDLNPYETLVSHYVSGEQYTTEITYSRYWHGYQIILKPLLEIMTYKEIRHLNLIVQIMMAVFICVLFYKRKLRHCILPYICSYLMLMPVATGYSLQFSACYYAFSLGCIALLMLPDDLRNKYAYAVFLNVGIFTAYFDFLTYPIATFGVTAIVYMSLRNLDTIERKLGALIRNGVCWCTGFGGMWVAKWLAGYVLTGYNTLTEAGDAFALRISSTSYDGSSVSWIACQLLNFKTFLYTPAVFICAVLAVYMFIMMKKRYGIVQADTDISGAPYFLTAFAPVVWYAFAVNHSSIHYWFTNKACVVTVMAILFYLANKCRYGSASADNICRGDKIG